MINIAFYNMKGGVGKTTTAVNMAYLAAEAKKNTVLWDWDPQGAASWYLGAEQHVKKAIKLLNKGQPIGEFEVNSPHRRLTLIPSDLSLRNADALLSEHPNARKFVRKMVAPLGENTSILIFDCPPSLSPVVEHLLSGVDLVLVPMIPNPLSLRAAEQILDFFANKKRAPKRVVGFFNMVDMRRKLHIETLAKASDLPLPMLKTYVPMDSQAEAMATRKAPLVSYAQSGRAASAYRLMWREVAALLTRKLKAR